MEKYALKDLPFDKYLASAVHLARADVEGKYTYNLVMTEPDGTRVTGEKYWVSFDNGKLSIRRIVAATDPGHAVNPQQIEAQVEGSLVFGLSALLYGEITVKDGRVEQGNFDTYPMLLIDEMPEVDVIIMPSGGFWGGVGEPTTVVAAPAVLNAIYAATGRRIRQVPLKNSELQSA